MTNQSRLKILGLGLVLVGLAAFLLPLPGFLPLGYPFGLMITLGCWVLPIIGLGCYARGTGRSVFWAAMGVVPILGPILALAAISIDEVLAKRAASRWIRRVVTAGFALPVLAFWVVSLWTMQNFIDNTQLRAEPTENLGLIFHAETDFFEVVGRYGTLDEIGFAVHGDSHRYTYRIDTSGRPGRVLPAKDGTVTSENTIVQAGVSADGQSFTATATANLDDDPTLDQWHVNDSQRRPVHDVDDSKL